MSSNCPSFIVGSPCGAFGTCRNSTCVCQSGWTHSLEFNYAVEENALEQSVCNYNDNLWKTIYIINAFVAGLALLLQLYISIRIGKCLTRKSAMFAGAYFCQFSFHLYGAFGEKSTLGVDTVFSFLLFNSFMAAAFMVARSYIKTLEYLNVSLPMATDNRWMAKYFLRFNKVYIVLMVLGSQLGWVSTLLEQRRARLVTMKLAFLFLCLEMVFIGTIMKLAVILRKDIKHVIRTSGESNGGNEYLKKLLSRTEKIERTSRSVNLLFFIFTLGPIVSNWWYVSLFAQQVVLSSNMYT